MKGVAESPCYRAPRPQSRTPAEFRRSELSRAPHGWRQIPCLARQATKRVASADSSDVRSSAEVSLMGRTQDSPIPVCFHARQLHAPRTVQLGHPEGRLACQAGHPRKGLAPRWYHMDGFSLLEQERIDIDRSGGVTPFSGPEDAACRSPSVVLVPFRRILQGHAA